MMMPDEQVVLEAIQEMKQGRYGRIADLYLLNRDSTRPAVFVGFSRFSSAAVGAKHCFLAELDEVVEQVQLLRRLFAVVDKLCSDGFEVDLLFQGGKTIDLPICTLRDKTVEWHVNPGRDVSI